MPKLILDDEDFLRLVAEERKRSIGFDHDDELSAAREKALNYVKGEMPDVPSLPNRSRAVSTDVADAIETALPDLVEIFVGGDDVATFQPAGPEDEEQAQSETDYVNAVIFDQNPGFLLFYSIIKDALTCKIGVSKSWWEETTEVIETRHEGLAPEAWPAVRALAEGQGGEVREVKEAPDGVSFTLRRTVSEGRQRNMAVPPEDFTFAADTVSLRDATWSTGCPSTAVATTRWIWPATPPARASGGRAAATGRCARWRSSSTTCASTPTGTARPSCGG